MGTGGLTRKAKEVEAERRFRTITSIMENSGVLKSPYRRILKLKKRRAGPRERLRTSGVESGAREVGQSA